MGISNKFFWSINKFSLMPLPFFILSGNMMAKGKLGEYLLNFANSFLKRIRGGMGIAVIGSATIFGAISGASAASAAAIGAMALPILEKEKYPKSFGAGLIAAGGTLAIIIPPSGILVLYGAIAGESTTDLFLAGIVPGLVIAAILSVYTFIVSSVKNYGTIASKFDFREIGQSFKKAIGALLLPVGILVPIYTGIATPTEVAAVSCLYALILCIFVYRDVTWKQMIDIVIDSAVVTAMIFFITMTASLFAFIISYEQLPGLIFKAIIAANINWWQFLMILNLVIFIMGFFLGPNAILLISIPIVLPVCKALGIDPIHLGILLTVNIELAFLTPPVGMNLYVLAKISKLPLTEVIRGVVPFVGILIICLIFLTFFPAISTFLVR
jgi:C4-dicarboxylate transporter DctM subunit